RSHPLQTQKRRVAHNLQQRIMNPRRILLFFQTHRPILSQKFCRAPQTTRYRTASENPHHAARLKKSSNFKTVQEHNSSQTKAYRPSPDTAARNPDSTPHSPHRPAAPFATPALPSHRP